MRNSIAIVGVFLAAGCGPSLPMGVGSGGGDDGTGARGGPTMPAEDVTTGHGGLIYPTDGGGGPDGGVLPDGGDGGTIGCTRTFGYWRTHCQWPVASLTLGGVGYDKQELEALLATPANGDASLILAHQLIGALLNVVAGVAPPAETAQAIADAQTWLAANLPTGGALPYAIATCTPAGADAVATAKTLEDFNRGLAGPPHCN